MKVKLKMIAISEVNYRILKSLGSAGESFNDVLTAVLKKVETLQNDKEGGGSV